VISPILLDTCAALWLSNEGKLSDAALEALWEADPEPGAILVSPVTAWEIGTLVSRGRLGLLKDPLVWFQAVLNSGIGLARLPPEILIASSFLPGSALRDPADRILAATARAYGYRLMTRDQPLLEYAAGGHIQAIAC